MARAKVKMLLAVIAVTMALQSLGASQAQAQHYSWWGWRPAPVRRTLALAAAPWVATWRLYYRSWNVAYRPYYARYSGTLVRCYQPAGGQLAGPRLTSDTGALVVSVPEGAKVFVNGAETSSEGSTRRYFSRGLMAGKRYKYEVRVERQVQGEQQSEIKTVYLTGGSRSELKFDAGANVVRQVADRPVETVLTLNLPADARLTLAGQAVSTSGSQRTFRTTKLRDGQIWQDYKVRAVVERGGRQLVAERTLTLTGGETRELSIDFGADRLAAQ